MNLNEENTRLNNEEYDQGKTVLSSYPQELAVQVNAPCSQSCIFCERPSAYRHFDIDEFLRDSEEILYPAFQRVNIIELNGYGELLLLPEAKRILEYFNRYVNAEKRFTTNGSSLTAKMTDNIVCSGNRYQISIEMPAAEGGLYREIANSGCFSNIIKNLKYLRETRELHDTVRYSLVFPAMAANISNLKYFIDFAAENRADSVEVHYKHIFSADRKTLSCYFSRAQTNRMLEAAAKLREKYKDKMKINLPPLFGMEYAQAADKCRAPWTRMMVNTSGEVSPCNTVKEIYGNLRAGENYMDVWNGKSYIELREKIINDSNECAGLCWMKNPAAVDDFRSHVITRGKSKEELSEFFRGI